MISHPRAWGATLLLNLKKKEATMKRTPVSSPAIPKHLTLLVRHTLVMTRVLSLLALIGTASTMYAETRTQNFDVNPPNWTGSNNTTGGNNFGFTNTSFAGGAAAGEAGGGMNNNATSESYYGDTKFGLPLTLNLPFSATTKFDFNNVSTSAKSFQIGYFKSGNADRSFLGLDIQDWIGATTKVRGALTLSDGTALLGTTSFNQPINQDYTLTFSYDPNIGFGRFTGSWAPAVPSGGVGGSWTIDLTSAQRSTGATFDGFGLYAPLGFTGNGTLDLFIDDATYTVPEPSAVGLVILAGIGLFWHRRSR